MESIRDLNETEIQRASILSDQRFSKRAADVIVPQDKYKLVYVIFFFFGLGSMLSMPFFLTANDYWMYKFRDISEPTYNSSNKTSLQTYFASTTSIAQSVPTLLVTWLAALYGHKIHIKVRMLTTLWTITLTYVLFAIFIKIDTDSWQTLFFIMTMGFYIIVTIATTIFNMVLFNLISRFPHQYMKMQMYGQGCAGLFSAALQVIALSVVDSTTTSALIYFICGTLVLVITLIVAYISEYSALFRFYLGDTVADQVRKVYTVDEMKQVAKKIWPCLVVFYGTMLTMGMGHPNITTLVVSENYGSGNAWNDKYFVPVITYMSMEFFNLLGRYVGSPILSKKTTYPFLAVFMVRLILLSPIFMFCNAQPRSHLPVWFPHDWEYMLIIVVYALSANFFLTSVYLSLPKLAGKQTEIGFMLFQSLGMPIATACSLINPLFVKAL